MRRALPQRGALTYYLPHAGILLGLVLNMAGLATGEDRLIGTGANVLTISALFLGQRRRRRQREEGDQ